MDQRSLGRRTIRVVASPYASGCYGYWRHTAFEGICDPVALSGSFRFIANSARMRYAG